MFWTPNFFITAQGTKGALSHSENPHFILHLTMQPLIDFFGIKNLFLMAIACHGAPYCFGYMSPRICWSLSPIIPFPWCSSILSGNVKICPIQGWLPCLPDLLLPAAPRIYCRLSRSGYLCIGWMAWLKALSKPSSQYKGIQIVITDSKCVVPQATIKPANMATSPG